MPVSSHLQRLAATTAVAMFASTAIAQTDKPLPAAGMIEARNTACARAQRSGQKCEPPLLPAGANASELAAAHHQRTLFFIDLNDLSSAVHEADQAVKLAPQSAAARHLLARIQLSRHQAEDAERETKAALALAPGDADILATEATRRGMTSRSDALKAYDAILRSYPDHRFSREARVRLLLQAGRSADAIADLTLLIDAGSDAALYGMRAVAYLAQNEPTKAIQDFDIALKGSPHRADLLTGRARAFELTGNDDAALRDYEAILGPVDGSPNIIMRGDQLAGFQLQRAHIFLRQKRFEAAATEAAKAITTGGKRAILRSQVFLRQNGFPETRIDGIDDAAFRNSLRACFELDACAAEFHANL